MRDSILPSRQKSHDQGATSARAVVAGWDHRWSVINLRGDPQDAAFLDGACRALGTPLPVEACSSRQGQDLRVVWAGPDDWFVLSKRRPQEDLVADLRANLADVHHAVTDVSGGYTVLNLSGARVRELMAQGCPLDLHPSKFRTGDSAGSVFFKASVWLWQVDDAPSYEVLVRSSFKGYVWLMVERCSADLGLVKRVFA